MLPITVSIYPVDCAHPCHLLRTQRHCLCPNGREFPTSACPPTPTTLEPTQPLIHDTCELQGSISKTSSEYCMAEFAIKHYIATYKSTLLIQQIWHGYHVAQENHSCFNISKRYFTHSLTYIHTYTHKHAHTETHKHTHTQIKHIL